MGRQICTLGDQVWASTLQVASLRKYVRAFDLQGVNPSGSKEDLLAAVSKHFAQEVCLPRHS